MPQTFNPYGFQAIDNKIGAIYGGNLSPYLIADQAGLPPRLGESSSGAFSLAAGDPVGINVSQFGSGDETKAIATGYIVPLPYQGSITSIPALGIFNGCKYNPASGSQPTYNGGLWLAGTATANAAGAIASVNDIAAVVYKVQTCAVSLYFASLAKFIGTPSAPSSAVPTAFSISGSAPNIGNTSLSPFTLIGQSFGYGQGQPPASGVFASANLPDPKPNLNTNQSTAWLDISNIPTFNNLLNSSFTVVGLANTSLWTDPYLDLLVTFNCHQYKGGV